MNHIIYKPFLMKASNRDADKPIPVFNVEYRHADPDKEIVPIQYTPVISKATAVVQPELRDSSEDLNAAREILITRKSGSHQFKTPDIQVGKMQEFLDILADNGIYIRVTSGIRPGAFTSSGNRSRHDDGHAIDITPLNGESWSDLITKISNSPEVLNYMVANDVGWLEEISEEDQKKYNASNANVHISIKGDRGYGEKIAIEGRKKTFGV